MSAVTSVKTAKPTSVALFGGGRLARAAQRIFQRNAADVHVVVRDADQRAELLAFGGRAASAKDAVAAADVVVLAVPAGALAEVVDSVADVARGDQVVLHAARGVGAGAQLPSDAIRTRSCWKKIAVLGGPLYVDDAGMGRPLQAAIGCRFDEGVRVVRALVQNGVRVSATRDVIGVEVCGAISNVGHLAAGLAAGVGFGETDQSLLHVRALLEAARLGVALGAERSTFNGLAGIGDLIPRQVTSTRAHREAALKLTQGAAAATTSRTEQGVADFDDATAGLEGVVTAVEVAAYAEKTGLDLPLVRAVAAIFRGHADPRVELDRVLTLELGLNAA